MICPEKNNDDDEMDVDNIVQEISSGTSQIITIISSLKDELTSSDPGKRAHAMSVISSILERLDPGFVVEEQVDCLVEYFAVRLSDKSNVVEQTIPGLHSLSRLTHFTFAMASSLFFAIQNNLAIQTLKPDPKAQIYQLIYNLYVKFQRDFVALSANFVYGLLRITDAETDPKSLEIIFKMYREIAIIPEFESYLEDIFDSLSCYFPITHSNKKDKYIETKIKLSKLLTEAMVATPKLAHLVLPMALENLMAEKPDAKLASYSLLKAALPQYAIEDVTEFLPKLWVCIRIDSLKSQNDDDQLNQEALAALRQLSAIIIKAQDQKSLKSWKELIWGDLGISFRLPELEFASSSVDIILATSGNDHDTLKYFFEKIEPIFLKHFLLNPDAKYQSLCLLALLKFLRHCHQVDYPFECEECLKQIVTFINNCGTKSDEVRRLVILILTEYAKICPLDSTYIQLVLDFAMNCTCQSGYEMCLQDACFGLIETIAKLYPEKFEDVFLAEILNKYDSLSIYTSDTKCSLMFYQNVLRHAGQEPKIATKIAKNVHSKLIAMMFMSRELVSSECLFNIFDTFHIFLCRFDQSFAQDFYEECISLSFDTIIKNGFSQTENAMKINMLDGDKDILARFFRVFDLNLRKITPDTREKMADKVLEALRMNDSSKLFIKHIENSPISINLSNRSQTEILLWMIFSVVRANSFRKPEVWHEMFHVVKGFFDHASCFDWIPGAIMAEIVLKLDPSDSIVPKYLEEVQRELDISNVANWNKEYIQLNTLVWICKSLFKMKEWNHFKNYFQAILEYSAVCEKKYAEALIDVIYNGDRYHVFDVEGGAPEFSPELHQLIRERYESTNDDLLLYLFLSHLDRMPEDQWKDLDPWYLALIVRGLDSANNDRANINHLSVKFVRKILATQPDILQSQIVGIFRSVVKRARFDEKMKHREEALNSVAAIIKIFGAKDPIINLKDEFVVSLRPTLADHKRIVRRSAAKVFCQLSMLGQPGSQK